MKKGKIEIHIVDNGFLVSVINEETMSKKSFIAETPQDVTKLVGIALTPKKGE